MSLIINKVSSSSLQVNYSYLESDLLFGYEVAATYKVDFADITYTNEANVLYEGIEALRQAYQRKNLVARIGGDEFINGRLTSQSFEESALVGNASCSITIEESKRLDDYSSHEFAQHIPSPQWIESFSESFSFSRSGDTYSSTRDVTLKYKQDAGSQFLNNAKLFLRNIYFDARPNFGYHTDGISENGRFDGGFRPLLSETIDLLGLSVSLQENLETSFIDGDHSKRQTYSLDVDQGGYLIKKYTVEIKAIKEPLEIVANNACQAILDALITANSVDFGTPTEIGKGIDKDGGTINLTVSFTNNPASNSANLFTYSVTKARKMEFYEYTINAEYSSEGNSKTVKWQNTKNFWASTQSSYESKISSLFPEGTNLYEFSRSTTFQQKAIKITDAATYTNDPAYNSSSLPDGVLKQKVENSIGKQVPRVRPFVSVSNVEMLETSGLQTAGNGSITTTITTCQSKGIKFALSYLKSLGTPEVSITSDSITLNSDGSASRVINYEFA